MAENWTPSIEFGVPALPERWRRPYATIWETVSLLETFIGRYRREFVIGHNQDQRRKASLEEFTFNLVSILADVRRDFRDTCQDVWLMRTGEDWLATTEAWEELDAALPYDSEEQLWLAERTREVGNPRQEVDQRVRELARHDLIARWQQWLRQPVTQPEGEGSLASPDQAVAVCHELDEVLHRALS
ncbi:MAG: hypothetical protein ACREX3_12695 [Gammaproteobacteria bacterium]